MDAVERVSAALAGAEAVLIGGGAGLSAASGIDYSGEAFRRAFADFIARYGFSDLYSSGFYPFPTEAERWAYWARHVDYAAVRPLAMPLYVQLLDLVRDKEYFVITTNVDAQFEKAGFAPERLFAVQGDYREMQCATACHRKVYSNLEAVKRILETTKDMTIPESSVPRCPVCGGRMEMHLRIDEHFIEDEKWHKAARRYEEFLSRHARGKIVLLELGVGFNTPTIIRYPFEELAFFNQSALLVRLNQENIPARLPIQSRTVNMTESMPEVVAQLLAAKEKNLSKG
ncbi:MAG: Sir2 silent information regulator family NAD-dependent deacetylase [Desulfovibrio sp.]|nr:Sir2 silent information regulator family NAD-dependent deacetylase [Desulfovibrio sp.]